MLTSLKNPLVKQLRKLHRPQDRKRLGLFLLEGTHLLAEACKISYPLDVLCATVSWQQRHDRLWNQASQLAQRVELVSPEVLAAIATTVQPDGVIAVAQRRSYDPRQLPVSQLGVVLETIQDPGNLGTMIRTAAAAGVEGLWISADSVDLDHPKVLRATAGQWFRLPMAVSDDLRSLVGHCQQQGMQVVATLPLAAQTYWQVDLRSPTIVLLGNEGAGLSPDLAALADVTVRIPLSPGVESLNVAVTCALMLYEVQRQRGFNPSPGQG
ncbi:MAG: RNA methyltransferase [Cyanobacteria bacterium]|nr:RNA methyltransferase [Cyanobacteriota bacterium]MDW8201898.1 RNA methyltransferase [Cyanobacteriota bacterium SKYGB_h_bin112]